MDQHPIPRQITTFEFKLIGFFTVKQFLYILFFVPIGFLVYFIFPIPLLNILLGLIVGGFGFALALVPINERPLDIWIKNLIKRLTSPTQYTYHKHNSPIYFFDNLYFVSDPHRVLTHIESEEKLAAYLARTQAAAQPTPQRPSLASLFTKPKKEASPQPVLQPAVISPSPSTAPAPQVQNQLKESVPVMPESKVLPVETPTSKVPIGPHTPLPDKLVFKEPVVTKPAVPASSTAAPTQSVSNPISSPKPPFFTGTVKNNKLMPLPGVLVYVKDSTGKTLRLLKTNPHGVFATFSPLPPGVYSFELKDPRNSYFFDTMNKEVVELNPIPFEFISKELL